MTKDLSDEQIDGIQRLVLRKMEEFKEPSEDLAIEDWKTLHSFYNGIFHTLYKIREEETSDVAI